MKLEAVNRLRFVLYGLDYPVLFGNCRDAEAGGDFLATVRPANMALPKAGFKNREPFPRLKGERTSKSAPSTAAQT